jgi:hypothetical protein
MTTIRYEDKSCALCGTQATYKSVGSSSSFGSSDLDTRPPELVRSTMEMWVTRCPSCGYCAPDVSVPNEGSEIVQEAGYRRHLDDPSFPQLASRFRCWSAIAERGGRLSVAARSALWAAWACDDAGDASGAKECRDRAVSLLRRAMLARPSPEDQADRCVIVDMLRRAERFDEALEEANEASALLFPGSEEARILMFQRMLVASRDVEAHSLAEVPSEVPPSADELADVPGEDAPHGHCSVCGESLGQLNLTMARCERCGLWVHMRCLDESGMCRGGCRGISW